jgi:5,10-methylenetetrahydromethanopterin reductase
MRFLLQLHGDLAVDDYPELAARAEALGFEDVTVHDVLLRRPVWPLLCDIARSTARVKVGPNVTHPYLSHPVQIAANLAHLDELAGGRAVLGIGRGSMYDLVGRADPSTHAGLSEAIDVIRALTAGGGGPVGGEAFPLAAGARLHFGTRRRVPVYLGALGLKGARFAGAHCDGLRVAAQWEPSYARTLRDALQAGAEAAGRPRGSVDLVIENWTFLHPDRDLARVGARQILAAFLPHLGPLLRFHSIAEHEVSAAADYVRYGDKRVLDRISDRTVDLFMAAGDDTDLRAGLERLAAAGFDAISFSGRLGPDPALALEILGREIAARSGSSPD